MGSGEQSKYCWSKDNRAKAANKWRENQAGGSNSWNFRNSDPEGIELMSQGPAQATSTVEQLGLERGGSSLGSVQIPRLLPCLCPTGLHPARQEDGPLPWQHPQHDPGGLIPAPHTLSPGKVSCRCRESKASSICKLASPENPGVERNPIEPGGVTDQLSIPSFTRQPFPEHLLCVGPEPAVLDCSLWLGPWQ